MEQVADLTIPSGTAELPGRLTVPAHAQAVVLFAHGSGSSRLSPRNRWVAEKLNEANLATLLFDLLTEAEAADRRNVFDVALCAERLVAATEAVVTRPELAGASIGYFGASTGSAAAIRAAAARPGEVAAIVSRGGRPDLAGAALVVAAAPTLLIVGSRDAVVADLNRRAASEMSHVVEVAVVPGAGHLFEEPGTLDAVAALAIDWFDRYLLGPDPAA